MEKIPTAEEYFEQNESAFKYIKEVLKNKELYEFYSGVIQTYAIQFARLHVEAAKIAASENARLVTNIYYEKEVDKDSILYAYPISNVQ